MIAEGVVKLTNILPTMLPALPSIVMLINRLLYLSSLIVALKLFNTDLGWDHIVTTQKTDEEGAMLCITADCGLWSRD